MITRKHYWRTIFLLALVLFLAGPGPARAAVQAPVTGEIEFITVNDPADHWSGGIIVVGGQNIIIPKNLLIDLPANRVTLQQLFVEAPAACLARGETGLAKGDVCNTTGTGGFATISAHVTTAGNNIAGDVLIEKGREAVSGLVTYISYTDGYYVVNGLPNDPNTGVMVRLNDPSGRHTIQQGLGCAAGSENCSADPRFLLDPDNYTNASSTGYPYCLPSTVTGGLRTVGANALTGAGDPFCPDTNRPATGNVPNSTRFAPLKVGDPVTAEGNFEIVNGIKFLSAHTSRIGLAFTTAVGQPDYLYLEEVGIDAPGFQNERVRTLFIGFTTRRPADVLIWSIHRDPLTNEPHLFPLATVNGCNTASGAGNCSAQGLAAGGWDIFKIRHDVDFLQQPTDAKLSPCAHLRGEPREGFNTSCPGGGTITEDFGVLSPIPHEIQAKTGQKLLTPTLAVVDVQGNPATWGQYLFPLGVNLGGIGFPEMVEIDLNGLATPFSFTGIPWNLDRRLSPNGCPETGCEAGALGSFALDPFPFEGFDPRTLAGTPALPYSDPKFTASTLGTARDRMLSYVTQLQNGTFNFDGNNTVLPWPPADPPLIPITPTPVFVANTPPVITSTPVTTATEGVLYSYQVGATETPGDTLRFSISGPTGMSISASGLITWTPAAGQAGAVAVQVVVIDQAGLAAIQSFTITVAAGGLNTPPAINSTAVTTATENVAYSYQVTATDTAGDTLAFALVTAPAGMNISPTGLITWTPAQGQAGTANVTVRVVDQGGLSAQQSFTIAVAAGVFNSAPTITSTAVTTATAGTAYSYQVVATDTAGDVLAYTLTTAPAGMSISASGLITWTPQAAQVGTANVTVSVRDQGGLSAQQSFTIAVAAATVNLPPAISSAPVTTATGGTAYSYQVVVADTPGDTFTYTLPTAPAGMSISATGLINWTPTNLQAGTVGVTVQAADQGGLTAQQSFTITVALGVVNTAPAITSTPITVAAAGTAYSYQIVVSDTPGDTFTFTLLTAPAGMTISATGLISWTPTDVQGGLNSVTVQAIDQGGLAATQSFSVTVAIAPSFDTLAVRLAEFRTGRLQWRVTGTAAPSVNQTVTIAFDDGAAAGTVIGTANVVAGVWTLDVRNALGILDPTVSGATRIRVVSTQGGTTTAPIIVRR